MDAIAYTAYSLDEWLHYFENKPHAEVQLGLTRIKTVADRLALLPVAAHVITVAGTNGKGSTVATLEAIYGEAGYRVGLYTSPHLLVFNERIRLNRTNVADEMLCQAFTLIEQVRGSIHLTYFEMATLAALLCFKTMQADVIILEVGLGGRLDATNIVDADLAIITTIDFDHEAYLGHTLDAIGFEKAGILRPHQTLIYADRDIPESIVAHARALNVTSLCLHEDFFYTMDDTRWRVSLPSGETLTLSLPNIHPNAAVAAVVAARCLNHTLPIDLFSLERAMKGVHLAGRQQVIYGTICTLLDVSHNPQSVRLLSNRMKKLSSERMIGKVHAVFSGLQDKDLCGLIEPMLPWVDEWYSACLDVPRAASVSMVKEAFEKIASLMPRFYGSIVEAYCFAKQCAKPGDVVVVYGSFYVVSPIMQHNRTEEGWICNG